MKWILVVLVSLTFAFPAFSVQADSTQDQIKARCADKWGDNYRMQKYCRKKQHEGQTSVNQWASKHGLKDGTEKTPWGNMFRRCGSKWTDKFGPNWRMVAYCLEKQEEAYRDL